MNLSRILQYICNFCNAFSSKEEPGGVFISNRYTLYAAGLVFSLDVENVYGTFSCCNMFSNNTPCP